MLGEHEGTTDNTGSCGPPINMAQWPSTKLGIEPAEGALDFCVKFLLLLRTHCLENVQKAGKDFVCIWMKYKLYWPYPTFLFSDILLQPYNV